MERKKTTMNTLRKGYKQTEVGVIPEDWEVKSIFEFSTCVRGGSPRPAGSPRYFNGDYIPWLTVAALTNIPISQLYVNETDSCLTEEGSHYSRTLEPETLIIANSGATLGVAKLLSIKCCANDGIAVLLDVNRNFDKTFIVYFINSITKRLREVVATGNGQPNLNTDLIGGIKIPLPPTKSEQTAIATALSDADALISSLEKLITKKRAIKQGAMQELLRPKEGWEVKRLGEIGECIIGLTYSPDNVKESGTLVLRSSNVQGNSLSFEDNVYVDITVSDKLIVQENDILICVRNGSRDLIGKCALIKGQAIGETFGAFMSVYRSPYNEFVFNMFQSSIIKKQIDEYLGATINQITNKSLNSFEIPFPPLNEQTRIATILSDMDAEIAGLEEKLSKYKQVKQGMMQTLLTGKIRLV